jgi:hypothetical protein
MDKEKIIARIMKECAEDGEPVTRAEAEEMAEMEINSKGIVGRGDAGSKVERKPRERKVDTVKLEIMQVIDDAICDIADNVEERKNETDLHLSYNGEKYSVKLTRHREKKEGSKK